ncbi:MAG TPA: hypothetical protein VMT66_09705 [Steroidobacteraceae bacterium]|nr:hypothetical protein [Steroidobacteraceae bacterium]
MAPTTTSGTPQPGFGGVGGIDYWNQPGNVGVTMDLHLCLGISSVTVTLGDTELTSFGTFTFPC